MTTAGVIVAAGRGTRAGGPVPKQWQTLRGRAVLAWTLDAFRSSPLVNRVVLVLSPEDMALAAGYEGHPGVTVVTGGATRSRSVRAGLEALDGSGVTRVLIHDVARPLVSQNLIERVVRALDDADGAAPALQVSDALWAARSGKVTDIRDRTGLWRAQTPQGFWFDRILAAHRAHAGEAADDVEVAIAAGLDVAIVPGEDSNLKITVPEDFARAEKLLGAAIDVRCGNGFDVHRFGPGDHVILCGVRIPHEAGLVGHSDADVGMHAVTDAIYGALGEGDIGRHFPPSDPGWKGADSHIFLEHAAGRVATRGFSIANIDCTLICERPRIGPHAPAMVAELAGTVEIAADRVSVKATTTESLGFAGRREGIAAMATVTLLSR